MNRAKATSANRITGSPISDTTPKAAIGSISPRANRIDCLSLFWEPIDLRTKTRKRACTAMTSGKSITAGNPEPSPRPSASRTHG